MPWLLDGNNLARGGDRETVRRAALSLARSERLSIIVIFDGPPPGGTGNPERLGSVEVRYVPHADTAILHVLAGGGRGWRVVTDDRQLAGRSRGAGAEVVSCRVFWEKVHRRVTAECDDAGLPPVDEKDWYSDHGSRLPPGPQRVPLRRRRQPR